MQAEQRNLQPGNFGFQFIVPGILIIIEAAVSENDQHIFSAGIPVPAKLSDFRKVPVLIARNKKSWRGGVFAVRLWSPGRFQPFYGGELKKQQNDTDSLKTNRRQK